MHLQHCHCSKCDPKAIRSLLWIHSKWLLKSLSMTVGTTWEKLGKTGSESWLVALWTSVRSQNTDLSGRMDWSYRDAHHFKLRWSLNFHSDWLLTYPPLALCSHSSSFSMSVLCWFMLWSLSWMEWLALSSLIWECHWTWRNIDLLTFLSLETISWAYFYLSRHFFPPFDLEEQCPGNESTKVQNARLCATKKQHTFPSTVELKLYCTE